MHGVCALHGSKSLIEAFKHIHRSAVRKKLGAPDIVMFGDVCVTADTHIGLLLARQY